MNPLFLGETAEGQEAWLDEGQAGFSSVHVIGAPGQGKSKLLAYMLQQDIAEGQGLILFDPHGYLYHDIVRWCATRNFLDSRTIALFDLSAEGWSFGFNPLHSARTQEEISRFVDAMIQSTAQVWGGEDTDRTPLLERVFRSILQVLAEEGLTLVEAQHLMTVSDPEGIRRELTANLRSEIFRSQWKDFNGMRPKEFQEAFGSTANRLTRFLHNPRITRILGQTDNVIDYRKMMDEGHILLVNLGGKVLSDESSRLLGTLMLSDLFARAQERPENSPGFRVYIDECHRFLTSDVAKIINEGRKFGLHLVAAHQDLGQLEEAGIAVHKAMMGISNRVVFGIRDPESAEYLSRSVRAGEFDYEKAKKRFIKPTQVGVRRVELQSVSRTVGRSETAAESESAAEGSGISWNDDENDDVSTHSLQQTSGRSASRSQTSSYQVTQGETEAFEPVYRDLPTSAYSLDELRDIAASELMNLPTRMAIVKFGSRPSMKIEVPSVEEGTSFNEYVEEFKQRALGLTDFAVPVTEADRRIEERRRHLLGRGRGEEIPMNVWGEEALVIGSDHE